MCHLPLVLWHSWLDVKKSIWPVKIECWVICLARCADCLHMVQLMPRCSSSSSSCHLWKTPICNTIVIAWSKVYWFNLIPLITTTHTRFNGPFSWTTRVSRYQKGKTNLDFTEARDSEWPWHQLGHMQVCTSFQTDNHASTPPLSFLQARCPSYRPTNSVKALKAFWSQQISRKAIIYHLGGHWWRFFILFHLCIQLWCLCA